MKPLTDNDRIPGTDDLEERMTFDPNAILRDFAAMFAAVPAPINPDEMPAEVGQSYPPSERDGS